MLGSVAYDVSNKKKPTFWKQNVAIRFDLFHLLSICAFFSICYVSEMRVVFTQFSGHFLEMMKFGYNL